ncbi:MAG: hypothetical protein ACLVHV_10105 [Oscillospiraceae bacterium]
MKKLFAIALCLILGAALLTGCSDGSDFRQELLHRKRSGSPGNQHRCAGQKN